jgi:hypothetical protein
MGSAIKKQVGDFATKVKNGDPEAIARLTTNIVGMWATDKGMGALSEAATTSRIAQATRLTKVENAIANVTTKVDNVLGKVDNVITKAMTKADDLVEAATGMKMSNMMDNFGRVGIPTLERNATQKAFIEATAGVGNEAPKVQAKLTLNEKIYNDVNPTARNPRIEQGESIDGLSAINNNTKSAHAEIGAMNQALIDENIGGKGILEVNGQPVCKYCQSDIKKMAQKLQLDELEVIDETGQYNFHGLNDFKNVSDGGKRWKEAKK